MWIYIQPSKIRKMFSEGIIVTKDQNIPCHLKKVPLRIIVLDNIPTLILFVLGFLIVYKVSLSLGILYGFYALFSIIWFWSRICPYCHQYNTLACPCGYGIVSGRLFKKKESKSFRKVFRKNIIIQYPNWFIPLGFAVYLIVTKFSYQTLYLVIAFSIDGFIIIPSISKIVGCRNCDSKEDCPWMTAKSRNSVERIM